MSVRWLTAGESHGPALVAVIEGVPAGVAVCSADLARVGTLIGPNDLLIAASARAHDLSLVTANVGEFSRVVGLRVEDWEAA